MRDNAAGTCGWLDRLRTAQIADAVKKARRIPLGSAPPRPKVLP